MQSLTHGFARSVPSAAATPGRSVPTPQTHGRQRLPAHITGRRPGPARLRDHGVSRPPPACRDRRNFAVSSGPHPAPRRSRL